MRITPVRGLIGLIVGVSAAAALAQAALPQGAVSLVNQDRFGSRIALCAETGQPNVRQGAKTIRATAVWVGEPSRLHKVEAGQGACDPAWSPDGRRLAVTASEGLWVFAADSSEGDLRVPSKLPLGSLSEVNYRLFSHPEWSPDGQLLGVVVSNGGTTWVEVFEVTSGRLFYTSPPENNAFNWTSARELKLSNGNLQIRLPGLPARR